jgi:hypothetical protein
MFVVGRISTTHMQWTVGEFTYGYVRLARAIREKDYLVTHSSQEGFRLYLPPAPIRLNVSFADPVPIRVLVSHSMELMPQDMTEQGFGIVAKAIMHDAMHDLATRCPRKAHCMCLNGALSVAGKYCGGVGRQEFEIEGMIALG